MSESDAFEAICEYACDTWRRRPGPLPEAHRIFVRDGWRCAVPGCSSQANVHALRRGRPPLAVYVSGDRVA